MKKIMFCLLTISLMGTMVMPVHAADVYADETTDLYFFNEETTYDEDFTLEYPADACDVILQQNFEAAMRDESIKLSEVGIEAMNLISTNDYDIDGEYAAEVNDYESKPILTRATSTVSKVEYGREWRIYRKSDNATMVQWVLRGLFLYNGKTSQCKQTTMKCYNNASDIFTVTSKSHYPSGMYAVGKCGAVDKKTGKAYSQVIRIGVTPTGKVVR